LLQKYRNALTNEKKIAEEIDPDLQYVWVHPELNHDLLSHLLDVIVCRRMNDSS
jgi:hypothetical protein